VAALVLVGGVERGGRERRDQVREHPAGEPAGGEGAEDDDGDLGEAPGGGQEPVPGEDHARECREREDAAPGQGVGQAYSGPAEHRDQREQDTPQRDGGQSPLALEHRLIAHAGHLNLVVAPSPSHTAR
jgi:hypothetical protein